MEDKLRATKIQTTILRLLAGAGVVSIALLAPNALQMLKVFNKKEKESKINSILRSKRRLIKDGYIKIIDDHLELTNKGQDALNKIEGQRYKVKKPRVWDHKWRIVIFDIIDKRKKTRDQLRMILNEVGFVKLQNSVWVYPYGCEDVINLIKTDLRIGPGLLYIIADQIENDYKLKRTFKV